MTSERPATIEDLVEAAVTRSVERLLGPHLVKLSRPEPLVYTVAQAAEVLQLSTDSVTRLVKKGVLVRVPWVDGKLLIPKRCVEELLASKGAPGGSARTD